MVHSLEHPSKTRDSTSVVVTFIDNHGKSTEYAATIEKLFAYKFKNEDRSITLLHLAKVRIYKPATKSPGGDKRVKKSEFYKLAQVRICKIRIEKEEEFKIKNFSSSILGHWNPGHSTKGDPGFKGWSLLFCFRTCVIFFYLKMWCRSALPFLSSFPLFLSSFSFSSPFHLPFALPFALPFPLPFLFLLLFLSSSVRSKAKEINLQILKILKILKQEDLLDSFILGIGKDGESEGGKQRKRGKEEKRKRGKSVFLLSNFSFLIKYYVLHFQCVWQRHLWESEKEM